MSINLFFVLVLGLLMGMYGYFSPMAQGEKNNTEVPKIHLFSFSLYEISHRGVDHILEGKEGKKFDDRYEITQANFSDNTKTQFQTIRSDTALYRDDVLVVEGNVHYRRADGLEFRSQEGKYDAKQSRISTEGSFVITQNANRVDGRRLNYDTERKTVSANTVQGIYQLD